MASNPVQTRLRRIEGQVQGVQRMLDADRSCDEVLTQLLAVRAGLEQVSVLVGEKHLRECVLDSLDPEDPRIPAVLEMLRLCVRCGP